MPRPESVNVDMEIFYHIADLLLETKKTLKDIFNISLKTWSTKELFIYEDENKKTNVVTYKEFESLCYRYASKIKELLSDIPSNSFVGLKLKNSIKWPMVFWGLVIAGYNPLLINDIASNEDTEKLIKESDAKAIVCDTNETFNIKKIHIDDIVLSEKSINPEVWANEVAFCTSGTTGDSRVYVFTGENLCYQIYSAEDMPLYTDDIMYIEKYGKVRHLVILPFSHVFGFVAVYLWFFFFGCAFVFPNTISSNDIVYFTKKYKVSHIFGVPLLWESVAKLIKNGVAEQSEKRQKLVHKMMDYNNGKIMKAEAGIASWKLVRNKVQKGILGNSIKFCIAGGSYLSRDTLETLNGVGYHLYNGYGMSEIGVTSVELSKDPYQRNRGAVGKALYGVDYKIVDNELCVKAPQIHSYRFVEGKKVPTLLDKDGYFHTGDIGEIDGNGYLFIKGKMKDVIITSNGENVYPEELEKNFSNIDKIEKAVIIGLKENGEEKLTLVIELSRTLSKEEYKELENDIAKASNNIPSSMRPTVFYLSIGPLPVNTSLKIKRYKIEENISKHPEQFVRLNKGEDIDLGDIKPEDIEPIVKEVIKCFSASSGVDKKQIAPNSHYIIDLGGDSFSYMSLVSSIEEKFDTGIPSEVLGKLNTPIEFALYLYKNKN